MAGRKTEQREDTAAAELPPGVDPLLTSPQVAAYIGGDTTARTLEKWRRTGEGPDWIPVTSRMVRYRLSAVNAWLDAKTRTTRPARVAA